MFFKIDSYNYCNAMSQAIQPLSTLFSAHDINVIDAMVVLLDPW